MKQEHPKRCKGASWRCGCIATTTIEINDKMIHCCDCCRSEYEENLLPALAEQANPTGICCANCGDKFTESAFDGIVINKDQQLKHHCKCCCDKKRKGLENEL